MKHTILKPLAVILSLFAATPGIAADAAATERDHLVGTWFLEVTGVVPGGGAYQNIMNVDAGGTADIVGGWMFGAAGMKFTDSPASVTMIDGDRFEIRMFAFLADTTTGAPSGMNITVYRGEMQEGARSFQAEADLYYLPCTIDHCPAPDLTALGAPATVAKVVGTRLVSPM